MFAATQEPGVIPGAIAPQRHAEIEAAGQRHLAALSGHHRLLVRIQDFDIEARLQQNVP
jgi:hypothetical protein